MRGHRGSGEDDGESPPPPIGPIEGQTAIPAVLRHQLLAVREIIDAILAADEESTVGSENGTCPHPSESRVEMASMGKGNGEHFYCKLCGETIGGD